MNNKIEISSVLIENKIFTFRSEQVMLDFHLAELYQVETKRLNEQVKRNSNRFPEAFMFQLSKYEWDKLQSQIATSSKLKSLSVTTSKHGGRRTNPYIFAKQRIASLSGILECDSVTIINQIKKLI